jgi:polyisoprenoid-binding protein YceI
MIRMILILSLMAISIAQAAEFHVDKKQSNLVKFISDAPMEDFEGTTSKIDGYMMNDGIDKLVGSEVYFEVDLNSVSTGIGLRDRHMREDYLHTDKYKLTSFKGKIATANKVSDTEYDFTANGKKFIHGVTKDITIKGNIFKNGNGYKVKANWAIKLPDYNIEVPKFMFLRINEEIKLEVDFNLKQVK